MTHPSPAQAQALVKEADRAVEQVRREVDTADRTQLKALLRSAQRELDNARRITGAKRQLRELESRVERLRRDVKTRADAIDSHEHQQRVARVAAMAAPTDRLAPMNLGMGPLPTARAPEWGAPETPPVKTPAANAHKVDLSAGNDRAIVAAERAASGSANLSLDGLRSSLKAAQRQLSAVLRLSPQPQNEILRLKTAIKTLQRAEAAMRATESPRLLPAPRPGAHLAHGRARHSTLQFEDDKWANQIGARGQAEVPVVRDDESQGRIDHVIYLDEARQSVIVTEYKTDRFDRHTRLSLEKRVTEIVEQINGYRFAESLSFEETQALLHIDERPTTPGYAEYIEERCADAGISVVFLDE